MEEFCAEGLDFVGVYFVAVGGEVIEEFLCKCLGHVAADGCGMGKENMRLSNRGRRCVAMRVPWPYRVFQSTALMTIRILSGRVESVPNRDDNRTDCHRALRALNAIYYILLPVS